MSLIFPKIYICKKLTSVLQIHTCKPILVQMEDVKTIGQNVFVFDSIEQALNICHVYAYTYLLPLPVKPWKHLTKHIYLHTLIVILEKH
jgi:hypothetical protein